MGCLTQKTKALRFCATSKQLNIPDGLELCGEINSVKTPRSKWTVGGGSSFTYEIERT
jgi:hypothetical protein